MNAGKKLLPWLLIASSVVVAAMTYQRQASLDLAAGLQRDEAAQRQAGQSGASKPVEPVITPYQCDAQQVVQAIYSEPATGQPSSVILNIHGQRYPLYRVHSQAGELYATEQGINPGQGMRWHVQGLEARLVTMTLDHTVNPAQEQLLMRCQQPV